MPFKQNHINSKKKIKPIKRTQRAKIPHLSKKPVPFHSWRKYQIQKKFANRDKPLYKNDLKLIIEFIANGEFDSLDISHFLNKLKEMHPVEDSLLKVLVCEIASHGSLLKKSNDVRYYDKHSIGGVAGDITSLLVVPIVACTGCMIPKVSSRAITSAAGTADVMASIANVDLSPMEAIEILEKHNGFILWNGGTHLKMAMVDSKIIEVQYRDSRDFRDILIPSILSKKVASRSDYIIIDIPYGRWSKLITRIEAKEVGDTMKRLCNELDIQMDYYLSDGNNAIGNWIGPNLQARAALTALSDPYRMQDCYFVKKALKLSEFILNEANIGDAYGVANSIFHSGQAFKKFKDIAQAQGLNNYIDSICPENIPLSEVRYTVQTTKSGNVMKINLPRIVEIAKVLIGRDKNDFFPECGIELHVEEGISIKVGEPLYTIYARDTSDLEKIIKNEDFSIKKLFEIQDIL